LECNKHIDVVKREVKRHVNIVNIKYKYINKFNT